MKIALQLALLATLTVASKVVAETPAAVPPGFCLFSRGTAIASSRAGNSAIHQLDELQKTAAASLARQEAMLKLEDQTLAGQRSKLSATDYQIRLTELEIRVQDVATARSLHDEQVARTRVAAQAAIDATLDPIVEALFREKHCAVVMERNSAYFYANNIDLTAEASRRLDAALTGRSAEARR
ncbi:OmpH family outer membrane protein [Polymorphobacter sp. PAMC 29334]|uniref:OmpH family outer membrane protein n=1 Tax=Polymorphobacter sp. PAMC 29334 TaxID=2862331 RepID=UPI001C7720F7|nr:OmpH family outer membrane protein [Polymorphobacter sp. PAMC 29334]QYE35967.1 OmpH family outer membrane protein [Polymorphobacter sp. PAMC 29334]